MAEEMVTITVSRYTNLIRCEERFDLLTDALFGGSYSYGGEYLSFSDDPIRTLLKLYFPNTYEKKLEEFRKLKEEKEGAN